MRQNIKHKIKPNSNITSPSAPVPQHVPLVVMV
jgi:hypothetical protein